MPIPDPVTHRLRDICGEENILTDPAELLVYECDAYPLAKGAPAVVAFPTSTQVVSEVLALLADHGIAFVPRGAGTGLAGGCLAPVDGVCVSTTRMRRILEVDCDARCARVEAGVTTQHITDAVSAQGFIYEPDPSSQTACTIGGNVANNSGGPHTLKCGVTAQHVLGLTVVLPDGEILQLGGKTNHVHGLDLKSLFIGSEGTLGVISEVLVRLSRPPQAVRTVLAVFDRMEDAGRTSTRIIAERLSPAALEIMDQAVINIVEDAYGYGFPRDAGAILIAEIDGIEAGLDRKMTQILEICRDQGAKSLEFASKPEERQLLWRARKTAFGALGRLAATCMTQDGVVPRSKLPEILRFIEHIEEKYQLRIANNFHAGDGNIHPNILFDERDPDQVRTAQQAGQEILAECVRLGGSISGEHGIGVEKVDMLGLMYSESDLKVQRQLRALFDPQRRANPDKVFANGRHERRASAGHNHGQAP